jgi:hypothetical protein
VSSDRTALTNQQDGGEAILKAFRNLPVQAPVMCSLIHIKGLGFRGA